jgi:hypothetical protein
VPAPPASAAPVNRPAAPELVLSTPLPEGQFVSLDRTGVRSSLSAQLGYTSLDVSDGSITPLHLAVLGQLMSAQGYGAYGNVAISRISGSSNSGASDSNTELGGLELGGVAVSRRPEADWIIRGGLVLPTAPDDLEGLVTNILGGVARITDVVQSAPGSTWARFSVSPILRATGWILRADVGFDLPLDSPDGVELNSLARINLAAGVVSGGHQVAVEFVNVFSLNSEASTRAFHSLGLSYAADLGSWAPFVGLSKLFGDSGEGFNFSLVGGIRVPLAAN